MMHLDYFIFYYKRLCLDLHHHSRRGVNLIIAIVELLDALTGKCRLDGGQSELAVLPADADLEAATGAET